MDSDLIWTKYRMVSKESGTIVAPSKTVTWPRRTFKTDTKNIFEEVSKRPKDIVWIVDDCKLLNEHTYLIDGLQEHFKVDIFGKCKNLE